MSQSKKYSAVKGVSDILPPGIYAWQKAEAIARRTFASYGFEEIRPPVIESTEVFLRSIGETTDIVEKEMYTFEDRAGRSITLRPEGTAPVVRCYVENHLYNLPSPQKYFYTGPMFRYERPQKGRSRQFYQIGVEAFGVGEPEMDAEIISMLRLYLERLGLKSLSFEVNSIGCPECRPAYKDALVEFFSPKVNTLCPDCIRRFRENPLRILDCKVDACIRLREGAPRVSDYICAGCGEHFGRLLSLLDMLEVTYMVNPNMVRGLDYYTRTTFEVTSQHLGSQKAVAAGGRYDRLVEDFGGPSTPAIGFAVGMERLTSLLSEDFARAPSPDVFIAAIGDEAAKEGLKLSEGLRLRGRWVELGYRGASLKSQMRRADRLRAGYVIIIGEDELKSGSIKWKDLRLGAGGQMRSDEAYDFNWGNSL